ncbi:patatin-like phospholipase family protein [Clostridium massiliamazoniense]|uniref:patatin-like phospholipase family protein n=1 Tax=Clostridium massiliamazoniense TaxID=1347366 RepID=UPI0006D829F6|nr:patatin-like phospholipase family protein [Clostridium massiliamazoniense]
MKIGLVLAGGGARGAYQIGIWKALRELNIDKHISVVSGTSIGALNAILFMQGDLEVAEEIWYEISMEKVLPIDNFELFKRGVMLTIGSKNIPFIKKYMPRVLEEGNVSKEGIVEVINKYLDIEKIKQSNIECYATCTEVDDLKAKYFKYNEYSLEEIKKIILATSAIPSIYEAEEISGKRYLDGGMVDNIPVQPVYGTGCDLIIISYLHGTDCIDKDNFPNTKIIEIRPMKCDNGGIKDGLLDFNNKSIKKRIYEGYEDTINTFEPIMLLSNFLSNIEKKEKNNMFSFKKSIKNLFNSR